MALFLKASIDKKTLSFVFNPKDILKLLENTREVEPLPVLEKIKVKTLYLRGEKSRYFPRSDFQKLKALSLKSFSFKEIKDAAHWLHADNPEDFKKALIEFFSS